MAKGKKTGGRDFRKGQKAHAGKPGAGGRPRSSVTLTDIRLQDREIVARACHDILTTDSTELQKRIKAMQSGKLQASGAEHMILKMYSLAVEQGDVAKAQFIFDRAIGRPETTIHHGNDPDNPLIESNQVLRDMSTDDLQSLNKNLLAVLSGGK